MRVIDLFAGAGGLSLGFLQSKFDVIFANEYDKSIAECFSKNHPNTEVDTRDIQEIDLKKEFTRFRNKVEGIIAGPPCTGFSQKGKRLGLNDPRNFLFRKFIETVGIVKPTFFLLENVPNLLTTKEGFFFKEISRTLTNLGYCLDFEILKSEKFGVPQTRRRAFVLGVKNNQPLKLPLSSGKQTLVHEAISDLPKLSSGEGKNFVNYSLPFRSEYQKKLRKNSKGIWNHIATNHSETALKRLKMIPEFGNKTNLPKEHRTKSIYSGTWSRIKDKEFCRTITTRFDTPSSGEFTLQKQDRCITVREAARIQSFPDTFIFYGTKSSQMKQAGNSVPPLLARAIANKIKQHL